jgi:hypothetical protein
MNKKQLLILILIIPAGLTLFGLSRGDTVNDEVFYAFRGIGMLDFDEAEIQTTPLEWQDPNIAWWTRLSFHDHPPLVFYTQHIFMKIFGENNFAFRLPSALLGIASVYLLYLLGTSLYSQNVGLLSAAIFGVTLNHIYISRVGMQEAYVIFFLLLSFYIFLKSFKKDSYLLWLGVILGLAFLTKYNSFILILIFLVYLLFFKREYFLNKKLWLGALLAAIIFSPVIIYNIMLYRTVGHFDFQFSYIFGQNPEVWKIAPGKDIGSLADRIAVFIPRLIATNSWLFLSLAAFSLFSFLFLLLKKPKVAFQRHNFLIIYFIFLILLILKIGPSYRFLTILTPFFALNIGVFLNAIYSNILKNIRMLKLFFIILSIIFGFEIFYSVNNQITYYPIGSTLWLSSKVRYENYNWGYNEFGKFLKQELKGKMPGLTFDLRYQFLENLREQALQRGLQNGLEPYSALITYYGNFDKAAKLWVLDRLHIYHAWPIISLETYFDYLWENGFDYYERAGFKNYYFILQTNIVPPPAAQSFMRGTEIPIFNKRGDEMFKIYKF